MTSTTTTFGADLITHFSWLFKSRKAGLPPEVQDWSSIEQLGISAGLESDDKDSLARLNDTGASFDRIADVIESRSEDLFENDKRTLIFRQETELMNQPITKLTTSR